MKKVSILLLLVCIVTCACAQQVSSNIKSLLSVDGKVLFNDEPNSLVVIDYPENLDRVEQYLSAIDVAPKQVLIEARVVEVKLQKENSMGVNWQLFAQKQGFQWGGTMVGSAYPGAAGAINQLIGYKSTVYPPAQSTGTAEEPFTIAIFDENVNVVVKALANEMDTDILSAPRVTTVNNREALIQVIQSLPWAEPVVSVSDSGGVTVTWTITFEKVGIILKVTPTINDDGTISLVLDPEVSEKTGDYGLTVQQGSTSIPYTVPIIDKRVASTKVVIGNGQTLLIGGMIKDKIINGETKIPLLGDLPALGYLFKSKKTVRDKTELLIFVSPTIITPDEYVRMERKEKYGLGRRFVQDRERDEQMSLVLEHQEKKTYEKLSAQLDNLTKRQESLVEERKKIEADVNKRNENIKVLQDTQSALFDKRKQLQKK
jgi:type II secretory pathway component GspD/PulD (secretin)